MARKWIVGCGTTPSEDRCDFGDVHRGEIDAMEGIITRKLGGFISFGSQVMGQRNIRRPIWEVVRTIVAVMLYVATSTFLTAMMKIKDFAFLIGETGEVGTPSCGGLRIATTQEWRLVRSVRETVVMSRRERGTIAGERRAGTSIGGIGEWPGTLEQAFLLVLVICALSDS
jgi:hypothetical protein